MNVDTDHNTEMTPREVMVLDVFRRLESVGLEPTLEVVAKLCRIPATATLSTCRDLEQKGHLVRGGRSRRSYQLAKPETRDTHAA